MGDSRSHLCAPFPPHRAPDLELDPYHPRRTFMRRALDLEVRLGYYDRILKTLPEGMQAPEALVMPAEAPGYDFEYESESTLRSMLTAGPRVFEESNGKFCL